MRRNVEMSQGDMGNEFALGKKDKRDFKAIIIN